MRAVVYEQFGVAPQIREVPDPIPDPDGVVLRVDATGLCRSDWHGYMGHDPDIELPQVPGHEIAGTVVALGADVDGWQLGQRVTVPFICACGRCAACRRGAHQVCTEQRQPGFTDWGSFAELVAIPRAGVNLVALPDDLGSAAAATLGCRFGTAFHAVLAQARLRAGETAVVHGCGGLGLATVMIAVAAGARVIAVDIDPGALEFARRLGAWAVVDATAADVPAAVTELTRGGAEVSFDCLGAQVTAANSLLSLAPLGRHVQVGLLPEPVPLPIGRVIARELQLLGSHGIAAHEYPAMLGLIARGQLRPADLVTRTIGLADAPAELVALGGSSPLGITVIDPTQVSA